MEWANFTDGSRGMDTTKAIQDEALLYKHVFDMLSTNTQEYEDFISFIETRVIPHLPNHNDLLDIGAGRGNLTRPLSFYFKQSTIVEPNQAFYDELMEWVRQTGADVTGYNGPWEDLNIDVMADLVILSHVLYYVPLENHLAFVRKAYSHLRPGGCMILALNGTQSDIWKLCKQLYSPEEFAKLPYAELLYENLLRWNFRVTYHPFHSTIATKTEADTRLMIDFLTLGKVKFDNDDHVSIREAYLKSKLRKADGYSISSSGGIIVLTKPLEQ